MQDKPLSFQRDDYQVSTDRRRLDLDAVHSFLTSTHWALNMPRDVLERAVANSLCFGIYHRRQQVGFGRVVTDLATYGYLTDVFVIEAHRGRGLGRWLVECMLAHPELQGLRRIALITLEAETLYTRLGFARGAGSLTYMELQQSRGEHRAP